MNPSRRPIAIRILIAGIILAVVPVARASDPGMAAADQVSEATYRYLLGDNQGEPGILYTHNGDSRGLSGAEHDPARDNIQSHFESYGLTVTMEPFTYASNTYFNVVATKLGTVFPDQEFIIGAHFDSVGNPGADDNASGTALVLEAARILSQYDSDYTLRFIAFDREEQGLIGSNAYVSDHATDNILGMISADMVAFNTGTNMADIYGGSGSTMLKAALADAVALYGDGLNVALQGASGGSDHAPFEGAGFQACLFIEDWGNPNYHTAQDSVDTPNYIDYAFAVRMTRSVVGFLVDQAGVQVAIDALDFNYPNGQPEFIDPAGGTTMRVEVIGMGTEVPAPGTGMLNYDDGGGWQSVPMNVVADNIYDAVFPAVDCGTQVSYSISADSVSGGSYTDPAGAPASAYSVISGSGYTVSFSDDFEIDQGWTASAIGATGGFWERGVPVDDPNWAYDPASDSDGSGQCFLTGNQAGNSDVDDGAVLLMSPLLDMSDGGRIAYDFYLYLTSVTGADILLVEANNTGGLGFWYEVARHDWNGGLTWHHHEVDLAATGITLTASMRVRFTVNDGSPQSVVEAGVDAFSVTGIDCCPGADGDFDGTGGADGDDIQPFVDALLGAPTQDDICHGDFNQDGILDTQDLAGMTGALLAG